MIRSRVLGVLAIALFLAGCLCAEAAPAAYSKEKAEKDVTDLKDLTESVLGHAQTKFTKAESTKSDVEDQNTKADNAESDAKKAAQTITATERKTQVDDIVKKATAELGTCHTLYDTVKAKADQASKPLEGFVTSASALVQNAQIEIPDTLSPSTSYEQVIASAADFSGQTTALSKQINDSTLLSDDDSELVKLKDSAKKIEVFKYQAESIAVVFQIETALKTAETDIRSIEGKKGEINTIVKEIKTKCEGAPDMSKSSLSSLCTTANSQLQTATTKLQEAQQCNTGIQERKKQLDATLKTLMATDEEHKVTEEAANVKQHEVFIDGELQKITAALGEVKNALSSAKGVQQQMQDALEKTSEQPVDANLDSTKQNKSTQLADQQTQNPKGDKSELLKKDQLRNITKEITNNPLIGGEVPTRSAANDSAVTVFIPLLVILVISAVLH